MKELIEALHIIKDECKKHDGSACGECPMWSDEGNCCCVTDVEPSLWKINDGVQKALL
jgi:hypothetical protein